jgi:hypothetical protein
MSEGHPDPTGEAETQQPKTEEQMQSEGQQTEAPEENDETATDSHSSDNLEKVGIEADPDPNPGEQDGGS